MRQNAPPKFLQEECAKNHAFVLRQAAITPRVRIARAETETVAPGLHVVRIIVENEGFLPTNISDKATRLGVAQPVTAELTGAGAEVLLGEAKQTLGHLEGRAQATGWAFSFGTTILNTEARAEWLVRAAGPLTVTVASQKGGTVRHEMMVGSE